jgi:hypothetical protein
LAAPAVLRSPKSAGGFKPMRAQALGEQVAKPAIDLFNAIAGDQMQIELVLRRPVGADG